MEIIPLAFESLGTRGMCTWVGTSGPNVLIDPGVNLAPDRFGLGPHPIELRRKEEHWKTIEEYANTSDVLIVTHYHFDHMNPDGLHVFRGKRVLVKDPRKNVNYNQEQRARKILPIIESLAAEVHYSDGCEFDLGSIRIEFSEAVHHGTHPRVYTTEVAITDAEGTLVHTSDVVGAELDEHVDFVLRKQPDFLIVDGPNFSVKRPATQGIRRMVEDTPVSTVVVEHHLLRDERWKEQIEELYEVAEKRKVRLLSAAEYLGRENDLLEARRRELYSDEPVESEE